MRTLHLALGLLLAADAAWAVTTPPAGVGQGTGPVATPAVPAQSVTVPGLTLPAVCTSGPCTSPTTVPSQSVSTPAVPAVDPPPVKLPNFCVPAVLCTGTTIDPPPTPSIPATTVSTPPVGAPPLCTILPKGCQAEVWLLPTDVVVLPAVAPVEITDGAAASASTPGLTVDATPGTSADANGVRANATAAGTPVGPVVLCPAPCPVSPRAVLSTRIVVVAQSEAGPAGASVPLHAALG